MKKSATVGIILSVFIVMPIWFYLLHFLLVQANATSLEMFLYWAYLPIATVAAVIHRIAED